MPRRRQRTQRGVSPGWRRVTFNIPERLDADLERVRDRMPTRSARVVGTAAIAAFVGLPREVQERLYTWAHLVSAHPDRCRPHEAMNIIARDLERALADKIRDELRRIDTESQGKATVGDVQRRFLTFIEPPTEREGFVEQVYRSYEVTDEGDDTAEDKGEDGDEGKRTA